MAIENTIKMSNTHDVAIDVCKIIATLMVINCHMGACYPEDFQMLATGASIGNALFFFCMGYTFFLKDGVNENFFFWYKKRVRRIVPSLLAMSILSFYILDVKLNVIESIFGVNYWFIQCTWFYYVFIFFIQRYLSKHLYVLFLVHLIISCICYYFFFYPKGIPFYGDVDSGIRQIYYFLFVLLGAIIGRNRQRCSFRKIQLVYLAIVGIIWVMSYKLLIGKWIVSLTIIPYLYVIYSIYIMVKAPIFIKLISKNYVGTMLYAIGFLCLDSYIIQFKIIAHIGSSLNCIFPLNIPLVMIIVLVAAFCLHVFGEFIIQTLAPSKYDWRKIIRINNPLT